MKRILACLLAISMLLSLAACHATDETLPNPTLDGKETVPPTMTATVPTEPTMPKELISEVREDGLNYLPYLHEGWPNSRMQFWFKLSEDCYPGASITYDLSLSVDFEESWYFLNTSTVYGFDKPVDNKTVLIIAGRFSDRNLQKIVDAGGSMFIEAVIRADGNIVGYGVFEIATDGEHCAIMRTETVIFPLIDGKFQKVSDEYAEEKIEELKQTVTPLNWEEKIAEHNAFWIAYEEARRKQYFEERKPIDPSAIIQITSSQDVLAEDPAVTQMNVVKGYNFLENRFLSPDADWLKPYNYYLLGSSEYTRITYICSVEDKDLRPQYGQYDARTNYGGFCNMLGYSNEPGEYLGAETTVDALFRYLGWVGPYDIPDIDPTTIEKPDRIWIDVIIRDGDYIVGFAIYELLPWENYYEGYYIVDRYEESYKLVDGHFQNITEQFVDERIDAYHRYAESNP